MHQVTVGRQVGQSFEVRHGGESLTITVQTARDGYCRLRVEHGGDFDLFTVSNAGNVYRVFGTGRSQERVVCDE